MDAYLRIESGKIDILLNGADTPAFSTDSAYEAARYLFDHDIFSWMQSSSMDFGTDYGWPVEHAGQEVAEQLERLNAAQLAKRAN